MCVRLCVCVFVCVCVRVCACVCVCVPGWAGKSHLHGGMRHIIIPFADALNISGQLNCLQLSEGGRFQVRHCEIQPAVKIDPRKFTIITTSLAKYTAANTTAPPADYQYQQNQLKHQSLKQEEEDEEEQEQESSSRAETELQKSCRRAAGELQESCRRAAGEQLESSLRAA